MTRHESDRMLLARMAAGDERAMENMFNEHQDDMVEQIRYKWGLPRALAEEIYDDAFIQFLGLVKNGTITADKLHTSLKGFLWRIVYYISQNAKRKFQRDQDWIIRGTLDEQIPDRSAHHFESRELCGMINKAVFLLSKECRVLLLMVKKRSSREIATHLNVSQKTVYNRLDRCKDHLRKNLGFFGIDPDEY